MMSFEDLENPRANRAVKEAAKEAKKANTAGKRTYGRKRKGLGQAGMPETEAKIVRMSERRSRKMIIVSKLWRVPVAQMW